MLLRHRVEIALLVLLGAMIFFTFSPEDETYFWQRWAVAAIFMFFIFLTDIMFYDESSFMFDPDPENWKRRTEVRY